MYGTIIRAVITTVCTVCHAGNTCSCPTPAFLPVSDTQRQTHPGVYLCLHGNYLRIMCRPTVCIVWEWEEWMSDKWAWHNKTVESPASVLNKTMGVHSYEYGNLIK